MKQLWQRINLGRDFAVIAIADDVVRGVRFHHKGKAWQLSSSASAAVGGDAPEALSEVCRQLGNADFCVVTGRVPGALFFRFPSTELPVSAQRGAVEFELPRHLLRLPEKYDLQFASDVKASPDGSVGVNVAVLPAAEVKHIVRQLERAQCRADEFIYPFLAFTPEFETLRLPEVEKDFFFSGNMWNPVSGEAAVSGGKSVEFVKNFFVLPDDFPVADYLTVLVTAVLVARGSYHRAPEAFRVLPEKVRPVRYRKHLVVSALLAVLLVINIGWKFFRTYGSDISEYRSLSGEVVKLKSLTSQAKSAVKRAGKELKEMSRIVDMDQGETEAVREFGLISEILPANVMVSSMRWSDTDIDMVLQCENDKLDLPSLIQPLKRWKIAQLQQRQAGDSAVATINLKLSPLDAADKNKKEAKR